MGVEYACAFLRKMLADPALAKRQPVPVLTDIGRKQHGLTRSDLRAARKELGLVSERINGVWYWSLPEDAG